MILNTVMAKDVTDREAILSDSAKQTAADILRRMQEDGTDDTKSLQIAYAKSGAFRRVLVERLGEPKPGEKYFSDPSYPLTGHKLRELCEAVLKS